MTFEDLGFWETATLSCRKSLQLPLWYHYFACFACNIALLLGIALLLAGLGLGGEGSWFRSQNLGSSAPRSP